MNVRRALTALGAGLTTGLLVTALVVELLDFELSALVGLPVGILAGLTVLATVAVVFDAVTASKQRALSAYAAFGLSVIALAALSYINAAGGFISGTVAAGAGLTMAVLTYLGLWRLER